MNNQNALSESQEQSLIIYPGRLKMLLGLAGSLAFVAIGLGLGMGLSGDLWHKSIGIVCISFFGFGVLMFLIGFIHPFPILVVNEQGIQQRSLFLNRFVAWEETDAIISTQGRYASLNIFLSEAGEETFSTRYPRLRHFSHLVGQMPALSVYEFLLPVSARNLSTVLQERYREQIEEYNIIIG